METKFYVDGNGAYLGGFAGEAPSNSTEVSSAPSDARQVWNGSSWTALNIPKFKIYDLMVDGASEDKTRLPIDIDFRTALSVDLYQETVMDHGAPTHKQYYTNATMNEDGSITYSNPIVRIDYTFERDSISLAKSCTQRFKWYDTNGNLSSGYKDVKDFYNNVEAMAEAKQRRNNIIDDLKVKTIGLLMYTESISQADAADMGKGFLAQYKVEIYNYIDEANSDFHDAVSSASADTYPWLENATPYSMTIRQFILAGLS